MKKRLAGTLAVPGDKSITHRALIFSAFARGACSILRPSPADDCRRTATCLQRLGMDVEIGPDRITIRSKGISELLASSQVLDAGNSGTTMRLLSGLLAGRPHRYVLDGDASLRSRPMSRVLVPLSLMGARVEFLQEDGFSPFAITGGSLQGRAFVLPVASAQVQTALLMAGLQAEGTTVVELPAPVRDHTLRLFNVLGIPHQVQDDRCVRVERLSEEVAPFQVEIPADISSAAFFMVAAACLEGSDVTLKDITLNPGRDLIIEVLKEMGVELTTRITGESCGEPVAEVRVKGGSKLIGAVVKGDRIARGVDEIPALAVAGALCSGTFVVDDAGELRVKESDRIKAITANLQAAGAAIVETEKGFTIEGTGRLQGGSQWRSFGDHRMAMAGMIAGLVAEESIMVDQPDCVAVSYPQFEHDLRTLVCRG